jgi:hypothetical protein
MTPSTNRRSARSATAKTAEPSTTNTEPPTTSTIKPSGPSGTDSSASSTDASNTTPSTTKTNHGRTADQPRRHRSLTAYGPGVSNPLRRGSHSSATLQKGILRGSPTLHHDSTQPTFRRAPPCTRLPTNPQLKPPAGGRRHHEHGPQVGHVARPCLESRRTPFAALTPVPGRAHRHRRRLEPPPDPRGADLRFGGRAPSFERPRSPRSSERVRHRIRRNLGLGDVSASCQSGRASGALARRGASGGPDSRSLAVVAEVVPVVVEFEVAVPRSGPASW